MRITSSWHAMHFASTWTPGPYPRGGGGSRPSELERNRGGLPWSAKPICHRAAVVGAPPPPPQHFFPVAVIKHDVSLPKIGVGELSAAVAVPPSPPTPDPPGMVLSLREGPGRIISSRISHRSWLFCGERIAGGRPTRRGDLKGSPVYLVLSKKVDCSKTQIKKTIKKRSPKK